MFSKVATEKSEKLLSNTDFYNVVHCLMLKNKFQKHQQDATMCSNIFSASVKCSPFAMLCCCPVHISGILQSPSPAPAETSHTAVAFAAKLLYVKGC